jgi:ABC-2 type transport system permease protein
VRFLVLSLYNVMRKELIQVLRDRRMIVMLVIAPVIQLVIFGYALDLDVDHIPTVVCDQDHTPESRELIESFFAEGTFTHVVTVDDPDATHAALESGTAAAALVVPRGFAERRARADSPEVQVLVDGTDALRAQVAVNWAGQFLRLHGVGNESEIMSPDAASLGAGAPLVPRIRYNQRLKSPIYMLPGVITTLLMNVTAIVTAMGLSRERETGTLEQILVTPIRPSILLAGKCLPYVTFGFVDTLAVLLLGSLVFDLPLAGSFGVVAFGAFLYLFSTLGIGIFIASVSSSQQQAMLGAIAFMLPAMLLSGFMSPISSMPSWLQPFTWLNPMRHFLEIMRACLLKGATVADLGRQLLALTVLGAGILTLSVMRFRKRLA